MLLTCSLMCLWFQVAMESTIRDVFRHCIRFPVPISASVVTEELMDTATDKRCITVLAREFSGEFCWGFFLW